MIFSLFDLPTVIRMIRIIRSFFGTHTSQFFAIQSLKGNKRREMCFATQCKLDAVTVLQSVCFSTNLSSAQICFPQDHTYFSLLSFFRQNSCTTLKSMANNGSLSMHRISPSLSQIASRLRTLTAKRAQCWYIRETCGLATCSNWSVREMMLGDSHSQSHTTLSYYFVFLAYFPKKKDILRNLQLLSINFLNTD